MPANPKFTAAVREAFSVSYEVHEGRPSWHQARAGAISAGVTTGFVTRAAADEFADRLRAHHPSLYVFVREVRSHAS